jgi:diguanylate cyclase (GGDEF)-like protein
MQTGLKGMSHRGWIMLARWTGFGTLGCVAISVTFNALLFSFLAPEALGLGILSAVVLPVILAGPLFFYLTLKLRELAVVNHKLKEAASTDFLTAVLNRRAFSGAVRNWLEGACAEHRGGAFLLIDADHFKGINDRHGHETGDMALKLITASIRACVRGGDSVGRLGGEEFGVFLPGLSRNDAEAVAERIRRTVESLKDRCEEFPCRMTVSIGGVHFTAPADFDVLFRVADERLYVAKHSGRNRVSMAFLDPVHSQPGEQPKASSVDVQRPALARPDTVV